MHLLCQLERHHASSCEVWNDGYFFSFCERCGADMARRPGHRWRAVRAPNRVVWRPRQPFDMPWRPDSALLQPPGEIPITAEWRALIERSQRAASAAPVRPLRWAEERPLPDYQSGRAISPVTAASASSPIAAPAARSVG